MSWGCSGQDSQDQGGFGLVRVKWGDSGPIHRGLESGGQEQALLGTPLPSPGELLLDSGLSEDGSSSSRKPT